MGDPVTDLRNRFAPQLASAMSAVELREDAQLSPKIRWSPHVVARDDEDSQAAWHLLPEIPTGPRWHERMREAVEALPNLRLGVCGPENVVLHESVLSVVDDLRARVATVESDEPDAVFKFRESAADMIYEDRVLLSRATAALILNRLLERCSQATTNYEKGVTLEVLIAVLLSQVRGFEVISRGVSARAQQIDVQVHNRNASGILGDSPLVIAEAKNWDRPVGAGQYVLLHNKVVSRFGRSRIGFFVTTDRFTAGVEDEMLRDSKGNIVIATLDKETLPKLWRTGDITANIERAVVDATNT